MDIKYYVNTFYMSTMYYQSTSYLYRLAIK